MGMSANRIDYHYIIDGLSEEELDFVELLPYADYTPQYVSTETLRAAKKRCRELGEPIPRQLVTILNRAMRDMKYGGYDVLIS